MGADDVTRASGPPDGRLRSRRAAGGPGAGGHLGKSAATPRLKLFRIDDLGRLDDEALRTFLSPAGGGIAPAAVGCALVGCDEDLVRRVGASLPAAAASEFSTAHTASATPDAVAAARRRVLQQLFWPLVYWLRADDYEALIGGEQISPRILAELDIDGKTVCDIGAGTGRFTLLAAPRARCVVAVDGVPALLERLANSARRLGFTNVETRRASFASLPLPDASVDVAVACSAFTTREPHGGSMAVGEAERIVRPGGEVAIIWPQNHRWLMARGYHYIRVRGEGAVHFSDIETAERLCRTYYSAAAARWVRDHARADVPYSVLGVPPPNDVCIRRMPQ